MSQGTGLFVSRNDYSGHQNIPWRETYVIKVLGVFGARAMSGMFDSLLFSLC